MEAVSKGKYQEGVTIQCPLQTQHLPIQNLEVFTNPGALLIAPCKFDFMLSGVLYEIFI